MQATIPNIKIGIRAILSLRHTIAADVAQTWPSLP